MSDIDFLALYAYHRGIPPLKWAEDHITTMIDFHQQVIAARAGDPATFPGYPINLTVNALACRILGELLDAGWTCPDPAEVLKGYDPPELPDDVKMAIAFLKSLPDYGSAAQKRAVAELGQTAPITELLLHAAKLARRGAA